MNGISPVGALVDRGYEPLRLIAHRNTWDIFYVVDCSIHLFFHVLGSHMVKWHQMMHETRTIDFLADPRHLGMEWMSKVSLSRYVPFITNICTLWALEPFLFLSKVRCKGKILVFLVSLFLRFAGWAETIECNMFGKWQFYPLKLVTSYFSI